MRVSFSQGLARREPIRKDEDLAGHFRAEGLVEVIGLENAGFPIEQVGI